MIKIMMNTLHMTPSSITSQDGEHLSELEMIRHEDVEIATGKDHSLIMMSTMSFMTWRNRATNIMNSKKIGR